MMLFLESLTNKTNHGRVYGLAERGIRIRKKICKQDNIPFVYKKIANINWDDYGWCLTGTQKRAVMMALIQELQNQTEMQEKIYQFYKNRNGVEGIKLSNLHDILVLMAKREIAESVKDEVTGFNKYKLTDKGLKIKQLMLA